MKTSESLLSKGKFIAEYSAHLMGAGVHTSRVVRNSKRIGEAFGLDVKLGVFHKNIILTIIDKQTNDCLLYTSPSPRDISGSRMPSSA